MLYLLHFYFSCRNPHFGAWLLRNATHGGLRLWRHGDGSGPQTTGEKPCRLVRAGKICVGKDHLVLTLPRIRAHRTARLICENRILLLAFGPFLRLVWFKGEELGLGPCRRSIHNYPAMFVARVQQAAAGSIRSPPEPAAMGARVPMRAGRNGLGKPDLPAGPVNQYKTKAGDLILPDRGEIIR
jgi:hypothetical protein